VGGESKSPLGRYQNIPLTAQTKLQALVLHLKKHLAGLKFHNDETGEKQSHCVVACMGGRVPQHQNTKP